MVGRAETEAEAIAVQLTEEADTEAVLGGRIEEANLVGQSKAEEKSQKTQEDGC